MKIAAEPVLASIHPLTGARITTMRVTMPTFLLAQFNKHRAFSSNTSSSRAIPTERYLELATFCPDEFPSAQKGMKGGPPLDAHAHDAARERWLKAKGDAIEAAADLARLGVHKEIANRRVVADAWSEVLVTSTTWRNFFGQRCGGGAQGEHQAVARAMHAALLKSRETAKKRDWHLPFVTDEELETSGRSHFQLAFVSGGRCRRISYGRIVVDTLDNDLSRGHECLVLGHMSPIEHQAEARPWVRRGAESNFGGGWLQFRAMHPQQACPIESEWTEGIE
jgi:Thymidylate synthase complementing protein